MASSKGETRGSNAHWNTYHDKVRYTGRPCAHPARAPYWSQVGCNAAFGTSARPRCCYAAAGTLPPRRLALRRDAASVSTSRPAPVSLPAALLLRGARAGGSLVPARAAAGAAAGAPARSSGGADDGPFHRAAWLALMQLAAREASVG